MNTETIVAMVVPCVLTAGLGIWTARRDKDRDERKREMETLKMQNRDQEMRIVKLETVSADTKTDIEKLFEKVEIMHQTLQRTWKEDLRDLQNSLAAHIADALRLTPPRPRGRGRVE